MSARLDHVVVVVRSLEQASREFAAAGFTVIPGGVHDATPTQNALVCFADGSYLELLATRDLATRDELSALRAGGGWERHLRSASAVARRFLPALAGPDGVADWVLRAATLPPHAAALRRLGAQAAGPVPMERVRPDGERLAWELLLPESRLLPFWIADRTPRARRVPGEAAATTHANGATALALVRLRASAVPLAALLLGDALGTRPALRPGGTSVIEADGFTLEFASGEPEGAFEVGIRGTGALPESLAALGVTAG